MSGWVLRGLLGGFPGSPVCAQSACDFLYEAIVPPLSFVDWSPCLLEPGVYMDGREVSSSGLP